MKKLNELFSVTYGNKFDFNKMTMLSRANGGVNFIGRSGKKQGLSGSVAIVDGVKPYSAGLITVSLGGAALLSAFVQDYPFYTAQNVAILEPLSPMTFSEKFFICLCIGHNRYRYSAFGREANRTLRDLLIPEREDFPSWLTDSAVQARAVASNVADEFQKLQFEKAVEEGDRGPKTITELFSTEYGNSYKLFDLARDPNGINFVSRRTGNNGVSARVKKTEDEPFPAGLLTVALSGNGVMETCVQPSPFYTGYHVAVLTPRKNIPLHAKIFYAAAIKCNRFRYGFGRQANRTLGAIRLPAIPSWVDEQSISLATLAISSEIRNSFAQSIAP